MEIDAIIDDWAQNAERHDSRNFKLLRSLKVKSERAVDRAARRLHEEAFSIIDCLQCANCCRTVNPTLTTEFAGKSNRTYRAKKTGGSYRGIS